MSHPVRVRGLKSLPAWAKVAGDIVAPRAGAWIEIFLISPFIVGGLGRTPRGVRGLKSTLDTDVSDADWSHPVRVRGLKSTMLCTI